MRGFNYSAAMKAKGGKWTFDDLNKFLPTRRLSSPAPHGLRRHPQDSERADVIAYLRTLSDNPLPLPKAAK